LGAYVAGTNPKLDSSIKFRPEITNFLKQDSHDFCKLPDTLERLEKLAAGLS
jgi:flagellar biosynthesis/type III secretory pathway ATPase